MAQQIAVARPRITPSTFFPGSAILQVGYVTTDVEEAVKRYRESYGIRDFLKFPNFQAITPSGLSLTVHIALAFVKGTQIELIQPVGGDDKMFREILPDSGFAIRHHHFGYGIFSETEWQEVQRAVEAQKIRIALESEAPGMIRFQYLDVREDFGHYLEYLYYLGEGGRKLLADVPRNE
jgi:Glyoxalase/Bleomycin resistance protein/Dioxygenase superfamily